MTERHHFDPGPTGIETRCEALVPRPWTPHSMVCGLSLDSPHHIQPEKDCVGCLTGYDIGLPYGGVAYPHPECPVHRDMEERPSDADKVDAAALGLLAISRLAKGLDVPVNLIDPAPEQQWECGDPYGGIGCPVLGCTHDPPEWPENATMRSDK